MINFYKAWNYFLENFKKKTKNQEILFRFKTGLEIILIPTISFLILGIFIGLILKLNLIYLKANGFSKIETLETAYYEYFLTTGLEVAPYIAAFFVINFMIGHYIGSLLLRPFKLIGDYCANKMKQKNTIYDPDFFTDLKQLTSFSEYFFNLLNSAEINKSLQKVVIPLKFTKIHRPKFEPSFFIQYFFILCLNAGFVAALIYYTTTGIYFDLIKISIETISLDTPSQYFLNQQAEVFFAILQCVMCFYLILTVLLAIYFYSKVSGPAFAVFATMRSFLKGNYSARVHLIGHYYVRGHCRDLNKYLDFIQNNLTDSMR